MSTDRGYGRMGGSGKRSSHSRMVRELVTRLAIGAQGGGNEGNRKWYVGVGAHQ